MGFGVPDELLSTLVPAAVYWMYSGLYMVLGSRLVSHRLHPEGEEDEKNVVPKATVVKSVLLQQAFHVAASLLLFMVASPLFARGAKQEAQPSAPAIIVAQWIVAMSVMDTWTYFTHRYMHMNKYLYKHVHSKHHNLVVPYAFGALYNHPFEALVDSAGGALSFVLSGMTPRTAVFFFSFATVKTVDDHCGVWLPGRNPIQALFTNNSAYHDVHHQLAGAKYNFSQPFFVTWDKVLGTYMPYAVEKRNGGGFQVRPLKKFD